MTASKLTREVKIMRKPRWERLSFEDINANPLILQDMLQRRRSGEATVWPYRCGEKLIWKVK